MNPLLPHQLMSGHSQRVVFKSRDVMTVHPVPRNSALQRLMPCDYGKQFGDQFIVEITNFFERDCRVIIDEKYCDRTKFELFDSA